MTELQDEIAEITAKAKDLIDRLGAQMDELAVLLEKMRLAVDEWKAGDGDTEAT